MSHAMKLKASRRNETKFLQTIKNYVYKKNSFGTLRLLSIARGGRNDTKWLIYMQVKAIADTQA